LRDLRPLLTPASIAIIGASSRPDSLAGRPLAHLQRQRFPGPIYPINPQRTEIAGLPCYPSVEAVPQAPELALIVLPGAHVLPALEGCARLGVRAAVVISSGFAEVDGDGASKQKKMGELAAATDMVICGPNSIGILNFVDNIPLTFAPNSDIGRRQPGRAAFVSQSGGLMASLGNRLFDAAVGLNYAIATGNEADLTLVEALEYLAEEPSTDTLIAIIEEIRDGPRFLALCRRLLHLGKPLIAHKIGRSEVGSAAVRSHTGALAGSYRALQAVFRQFGVIEAPDLDDIIDLAATVAAGHWPRGNNIAIVTSSGGAGAAAADSADDLALRVSPFDAQTQQRLREFLPGFSAGAVQNPFDVTAQAIENPSASAEIARILLADATVDGLVMISPGAAEQGQERAEQLIAATATTDKPFLQVLLSGSVAALMCETLRRAGVPVFHSPAKAMAAITRLRHFVRARELASLRQERRAEVRERLLEALAKSGSQSTEYEVKRLLQRFGITVVEERLARSAEEAVSAAEELGYPVVVKVHSPDITHKTEVGGVRLNLTNAKRVREAYSSVLAGAAQSAPRAKLDGVLVSRMVDVRLELIAGFHTDPTFGPLVLFGLGGIWAEALNDVAMRPAPIAQDEVEEMVQELRGAALLRGARGLPGIQPGALQCLLLALSDIAVASAGQLEGIDINPAAVTADGRLIVLDASLFPLAVRSRGGSGN
jgi:acyl-CoA synthetase (NDP forming)